MYPNIEYETEADECAALLQKIERLEAEAEASERMAAIMATPDGRAVWLDGFATAMGDAPTAPTSGHRSLESIWRSAWTATPDTISAEGTTPEA